MPRDIVADVLQRHQATDTPRRILVVRLGAMGDVIHTLPAVCRLKHTFPSARIVWAIEPRWAPLLEGNSPVDEIIDRADRSLAQASGQSRNLGGGQRPSTPPPRSLVRRRDRFPGTAQIGRPRPSERRNPRLRLYAKRASRAARPPFLFRLRRSFPTARGGQEPGPGRRRRRQRRPAGISAAAGKAAAGLARGRVRIGEPGGGLEGEAMAPAVLCAPGRSVAHSERP